MTVRYTQSSEPFKKRKFNGMTFHRALVATTKKEAEARAEYHRGRGALARIVRSKTGYEVYTR